MKYKKYIIISIFTIILILIFLWILNNNNSKKEIDNNNDLIQEYIEYNNLYITLNNRPGITNQVEFNGLLYHNIRLTVDTNICVFEGDIKNLTSNTIKNQRKNVIFKDNNNNEIGSIIIYLEEIKQNEVYHFYSQTDENFRNAYSFEVVDINE